MNLSRMAYVSHQSPSPSSPFPPLSRRESGEAREKRQRLQVYNRTLREYNLREFMCILCLLKQDLLPSNGLPRHIRSDVTGVTKGLHTILQSGAGSWTFSLPSDHCLESSIPIGHTVLRKENLQQVKDSGNSLAWG